MKVRAPEMPATQESLNPDLIMAASAVRKSAVSPRQLSGPAAPLDRKLIAGRPRLAASPFSSNYWQRETRVS